MRRSIVVMNPSASEQQTHPLVNAIVRPSCSAIRLASTFTLPKSLTITA